MAKHHGQRQSRFSTAGYRVEGLEPRRLLAATITARAFLDFNGNGTLDESGIEPESVAQNYRFYIDTNNNGIFEAGESDFFSGPDGTVTIGGLDPNTLYHIAIAPRDVEGTSTPAVKDITTGADGSIVSAGDYGIARSRINGRVYIDDNGNGSYDLGEGRGSIRVFLDKNNNGLVDGDDDQTWTTAAFLADGVTPNPNGGNYRFNFIDAGTYNVRVAPAHFQSVDGQNPIVVELAIKEVETGHDFVLVNQSSIGGVVFNDTNGNGTRDAGETLAANVRVFADLDTDGTFDVGEPSALSGDAINPQGQNYHIDAINPGTYTVRVVKPTGITSTVPATRSVTVIAGQETVFTNFGLTGGAVVTPGVNDFNSDGKRDIIVTQNNVSQVWYMNGSTRTGTANLPAFGTGFTLATYGDFDGDDKPDLLVHNATTGAAKIITLNGVAKKGEVSLPSPAAAWKPVGSGDFDADGDLDIVWRNSTTGQNTTWRMNGTAIDTFKALPSTADKNWFVAGVADFDNDGDEDIVWRHAVNGKNTLWLLSDQPVPTFRALPSTANQAWRPVAISFFNGDQIPDILWLNSQTNQNSLWFMPAGAGQQPTFGKLTIQV